MVEDQIYMLRGKWKFDRKTRRPFHAQSKFLKIISDDEDVMEDQIYVLPEKLITKPNGLSMLKIFEDY